MITILDIRRHDSAVVNTVVISDWFCTMKRQDVTFLPFFDYLGLPLYIALSGLVRSFQKN